MNTEPVQTIAYPYSNGELVLSWSSRRAKTIIAVVVCTMFAATLLQGVAFDRLHFMTLHIWLPCLLAILLTVAPAPPTFGGRLSKDAIALTAGLSCLVPSWQVLLILGTPALLALGALANGLFEQDRGQNHAS